MRGGRRKKEKRAPLALGRGSAAGQAQCLWTCIQYKLKYPYVSCLYAVDMTFSFSKTIMASNHACATRACYMLIQYYLKF